MIINQDMHSSYRSTWLPDFTSSVCITGLHGPKFFQPGLVYCHYRYMQNQARPGSVCLQVGPPWQAEDGPGRAGPVFSLLTHFSV